METATRVQTPLHRPLHLLALATLALSLHALSAHAAGSTTSTPAACGSTSVAPWANCTIKPATAKAAVPPPPPPPQPNPAPVTLSAMANVGNALFHDVALSASGKQSCATCHTPNSGFTAGNAAPVPLGGANLTLQGLRNAPTLTYASFTPAFALNGATQTAPGQPVRPAIPVGGFMHDGRLASLAAQAQMPFITSFEMANASSAAVEARLKQRPYLNQFTAVFGTSVLNNANATLAAMGQAIAAYETEDPVFHAFNSKYDAFINGQTTLTAQESAGLQAFNSPGKGNCLACHHSAPAGNTPALFTDHTFHTLGVPRNWKIAYNLDTTNLPSFVPANGVGLGAPSHQYYDMGLCGPLRTDLAGDTNLCGSFKVPTLRNIAVKQAYFHNGIFSNLDDVVSWYATRNSNPTRWYQTPTGAPDILYNDLPVAYAHNVEPVNAPGHPIAPNLNPTDVKNIVSFLCTLTDGFDPKNPAAYTRPAQCQNP